MPSGLAGRWSEAAGRSGPAICDEVLEDSMEPCRDFSVLKVEGFTEEVEEV